jgi:uncharacterized protein YdcH (DUF465 family)
LSKPAKIKSFLIEKFLSPALIKIKIFAGFDGRRLADFSETLGGIVAPRATIRSQRQDFVQSRFEFCPKDTAMNTVFIDNPIFFLIFTAIALLVLWNIYLHSQLWQTKKKLKVFFAGKKASDLEGVLFEEIKRLKKSEADIKKLFKSSEALQKMASLSIQKVGVVRFNPFKGTGGDQSFAIALLDSRDNGLVISSLYTQEGNRVYAKPVENGQSKYPLSKEEIQALKRAGAKLK